MAGAPAPPEPGAGASALTKLASHGAIYSVGTLLGRVLSLVMVPVYTHLLDASNYGILELLDTTDLLVVAAFSSPIADPVLRHYHDARTDAERRAVISTSILSLAGGGTLVALAGIALSPALAGAVLHDRARAPLFMLTFGSVLFQAVLEVPFAILRGTDRPAAYAAATLARSALGFALNITFLVWMRMGVAGMALSSFTSSTLVAAVAVLIALRHAGLRFDRELLRGMLRFGWPLIPGALAVISLQHSRSYVINEYGTLADVGVWSLGSRFGVLISQVLGSPLRNAWSAQLYAVWGAVDGSGPRVFGRLGTLVAALYFWAAAALTMLSRELIAVLTGGGYERAATVIPAAACAYAFRELGEFFRVNLFVAKSVRAVAWIEPALAVADIALGVWLVSRHGLRGAMVEMPLIYAVYALALHAAVHQALPVRFELGRIAALAGIALAGGLGGRAVATGSLAADIAVKLGLVALLPVVAVLLVFREPEERASLRALRRRVLRW